MADEQVKVGDVVQLKSGGPKMTVEVDVPAVQSRSTATGILDQRGGLRCVWFVGEALSNAVIAPAALVKVAPPASSAPMPAGVAPNSGYVA